jgi:hypothetical protein
MSFQLVSALFVEAAKPAVKVVPTVPPPAPVWPLLAGFALLAATAGALAKRQSLSGTAISCLGAAASFATLEALDAGLFKPMGFGCVSGPHAVRHDLNPVDRAQRLLSQLGFTNWTGSRCHPLRHTPKECEGDSI